MSRPRPTPLNGTPRSDYGGVNEDDDSFVVNGVPSPSASERATSVSYTSASDIMPLGNPSGALHNLDQNLKSKKWNIQFEALNTTRALALHHQRILYPRLHAITAAVVIAADSLRSSVAKNGLLTLNDMAIGLQSQLSKEGGTIGYVLIKRAADTSNKFVSKTACTALASLVTYCPGSELLKTLITLSSSKNASQRSESVKSMSQYVENHGFDIMDSREREQIVKVSAKMATDSKPQTRQVGRKLIWYCKNGNLLQQNMIKALPASDQQTISKVLSKGLEGIDRSSSIGSPGSVRSTHSRPSPRRKKRSMQVSRDSNRSNKNSAEPEPVIFDSFSHNQNGIVVSAKARRGGNTGTTNVSRENLRRRNEMAKKQQEALAIKKREDIQRREQHKRKTAEMAERGRQRANDRLQLQKQQEAEERKRVEMESRQRQKLEAERRRRQQVANDEHRRRTKERLAEYKQRQRVEAEAEEERQRRLAEAQARIKSERAKQARQKAQEERRKMHQRRKNAPRTETKVVPRNRGREPDRGNSDAPVKVRDYYREKAQTKGNSNPTNSNSQASKRNTNNVHMNKRRPMQRGSHDNKNRGQGHKFDTVDETPNLVGFPHASPNDILNDKDHDYYLRNDNVHEKDNVDDEHIDDVYINDALAQVKRSQGERHKAKYVRQNLAKAIGNGFDSTTRAQKNYAWKEDLNKVDYDNQDFEDDLNDALAFHPGIPKRGGTPLKNELSALGLDGIDGGKRNQRKTNNNGKKGRQQRKLLKLNEVGSYEYGAHGQLVPEGTLAWQQEQEALESNTQGSNEPLSPLSRFMNQRDSREFAAYQQNENSFSPAPIVRHKREGMSGSNYSKPKHWKTMTSEEQKLMQELAGLDQQLETNRRKNLKSTHSEPAYVSRRVARQTQRQNSIATAGIGSTRRHHQNHADQHQHQHQMLTQSPSGAWRQREVNRNGLMQQAAMNNIANQFGNAGGNMYNYQPSYGNAPSSNYASPVYHNGIAYFYPSQQPAGNQQQNMYPQQGMGGNLSQWYNQQMGY